MKVVDHSFMCPPSRQRNFKVWFNWYMSYWFQLLIHKIIVTKIYSVVL